MSLLTILTHHNHNPRPRFPLHFLHYIIFSFPPHHDIRKTSGGPHPFSKAQSTTIYELNTINLKQLLTTTNNSLPITHHSAPQTSYPAPALFHSTTWNQNSQNKLHTTNSTNSSRSTFTTNHLSNNKTNITFNSTLIYPIIHLIHNSHNILLHPVAESTTSLPINNTPVIVVSGTLGRTF